MPAEIRLEGMAEIEKRLQELGEKGSRVENKALKAAGEFLAKEIRKEAPRSLKKGIHLQDDIVVSGIKKKQGQKYVEVGASEKTNWRAKFLEFGTKKMRANPFMSRAYEKNKKEIRDIIQLVLKEGLG